MVERKRGFCVSVTATVISILENHRDPTSGASDVALGEETRLDALGVDSLAMLEIIFEIEEQLDIELPFNGGNPADYANVTVGDLVRQIEAILAQR